MKKLSEVHAEQDAAMANIAKQHGFKMNEQESLDGVMAEFSVIMTRKGELVEISVIANDEVVVTGKETVKNVATMYEAILDTAKEIIGSARR